MGVIKYVLEMRATYHLRPLFNTVAGAPIHSSTAWTSLFNSALLMMGEEGGKQSPDQLLDTP